LRHPPPVNGFQGVLRSISPVIRDLPFGELRQDPGDSEELIRFPRQILKSPKQACAGTAASEESAIRGLHEGVDLWLWPLKIFLDQAEELLRGGFGIERQVVLLRKEPVRCERRQQPPDEKIDLPPDTAEPFAEQRLSMYGEEDERLADPLAQSA
jgi:hypothetical protein